MKGRRDLIITDAVAVLVLLAAVLAGWREAALFGLGVLIVLNVIVLVREHQAGSDRDQE